MSEDNNKSDGVGLNRRNFLKSAGVAVAGGTLGAGLKLTPEAAAAAAVETHPRQSPISGAPSAQRTSILTAD